MMDQTKTVIVSTYAVPLDEKTIKLRLSPDYAVLGFVAESDTVAGMIVQEEKCLDDRYKRDVTFKVAQSLEEVVLEQDEAWIGMVLSPGRPIYHVFGKKVSTSSGGICGL